MNTQPEDNTKPEALRLAEWLETSPNTRDKKAAAELRRLHEVNQKLVEALEEVMAWVNHWCHETVFDPEWSAISNKAKAILVKTTGEST